MSGLVIAVIELEGLLAKTLKDAWQEHAEVHSLRAKDALEKLASQPPDLIIVPDQLSKGSGFGLVNRMRHMEALGTAKIILVSTKGTEEALDHHKAGPTPADAYLLAAEKGSSSGLADRVLETAAGLFPKHLAGASSVLPEADPDDVEELSTADPGSGSPEDTLAGVMERLGGYRVLRRLRDEDGGAVFACMDEELGRPVAVKIMPPADKRDDEAMQRFLRERQVLAVVNSPFVLQVFGAGTHEGRPYLVRELVDGESLQDKLAEGPLDVDQALRWTREAALALQHTFEAGVVHRDVCPANIYIVDGHVKLTRFNAGRAVNAREHQITLTGMRVQHQAFAAPERVMGGGDDKSDIYSLGVALHTLLAGRPPFQSARPVDVVTGKLKETPIPLAEAVEDVRDDVAALVARMMAPEVEARPSGWPEVIAELDKLLASGSEEPSDSAAAPTAQPSGIHGNLRRMGIVELIQTLELSRKTATVTVYGAGGHEGVLAFRDGQLLHASWAGQEGEPAFFSLVGVSEGAFDVGFREITTAQTIHRPTTGLLLDALRLRDEGAPAPSAPLSEPEPEPEPEPAGNDEADFFSAALDTSSPPQAPAVEPPRVEAHEVDDDDDLRLPSWKTRHVPSWLGYATIVLAIGLAGWGATELPSLPLGPEPEDLSMYDGLIDAQRDRLRALDAELTAARPALAAAASQDEAAKKQKDIVTTVAKHLGEVLGPDVKDGRVRVRTDEQAGELVLELPELAVFGGQTAVITVDGHALLGRVSTALKALRHVDIRVEAHSDDRPPLPESGHTNNWSLTGTQAQEVIGALRKLEWKRDQVSYAARAELAPLTSNLSAKGRARNRRIDLVITPSPKLLDQPILAPEASGG